jgi:hypothetical protein
MRIGLHLPPPTGSRPPLPPKVASTSPAPFQLADDGADILTSDLGLSGGLVFTGGA